MGALLHDGRPFLTAQAGSAGLTPYGLRSAVARGRLRRLLRGVYVDATVPDSRNLRIAALALVLPNGGVAWGRTAAWLWNVDGFSPDERTLAVPECAVPHHAVRPSHPGVRVVERTLPADSWTELGDIRAPPLRVPHSSWRGR